MKKQPQQYEVWSDKEGCEITFATPEYIRDAQACGELSDQAKMLYLIEASTYEEAMSDHYRRMGWGAYIPVGEPQTCPRCGDNIFYPQGSGECPQCGVIC